jgi:hypothetical protein
VQVQQTSVVTRLSKADWTEHGVGLDPGAVIVVPSHVPDIAIVSSQKQLPVMPADRPRRMGVL